ncbi:MAG: hypothetical protein ABFR97_01405 [Thermodesulfobacteriota bacterium]
MGRIVVFVSLGLVVANLIEALSWTRQLALVSRPLIRWGRLSDMAGASFSMAFVSGVAANAMLAEGYAKGEMSRVELVLANIFNSLPRFFLHLPTVFFLTVPFIGAGALIYVGLTFSAALLQTLAVVVVGRFFLQGGGSAEAVVPEIEAPGWRQACERSWQRLRHRLPRVLRYLVPVYLLFFFLSRYGIFAWLEEIMAGSRLLGWLPTQAMSIVILYVTTEFSAGLAAASAMLADNSLEMKEVVLALLLGNFLAAPVRVLRHQLPHYMGIFSPRMALGLVGCSQLSRGLTLLVVGLVYYLL